MQVLFWEKSGDFHGSSRQIMIFTMLMLRYSAYLQYIIPLSSEYPEIYGDKVSVPKEPTSAHK